MCDAATEPAFDHIPGNISKPNDIKVNEEEGDVSDAEGDVLSNMAEGGASISFSMIEEEQTNQQVPTPAPSTMPAMNATSTPSLASENSTPPPLPGSDQAERMKNDFYFPRLAGTQRVEERYSHRERIGEGTYGRVYLAREIKTGYQRALKVMNFDKYQEGFPVTSVREIKIAMSIAGHKNLARLHEILLSPGMCKQQHRQPMTDYNEEGTTTMFN